MYVEMSWFQVLGHTYSAILDWSYGMVAGASDAMQTGQELWQPMMASLLDLSLRGLVPQVQSTSCDSCRVSHASRANQIHGFLSSLITLWRVQGIGRA